MYAIVSEPDFTFRTPHLSQSNGRLVVRVNQGIEALWLVMTFAVPLEFTPYDLLRSYIEVPKVVLFRVLVSLMLGLLAVCYWTKLLKTPPRGRFPVRWDT